MKLLTVLFLLTTLAFSQQINHTWGYSTAGVAYTQSSLTSLDSSATQSIVFDLQDYYLADWNPSEYTVGVTGASSDTVGVDSIYSAVTIQNNSDALFIGTLWYRVDIAASDSSAPWIRAYAGNMVYHPNDGSRINSTNLNFSTTAITLLDTTYSTSDVQWTAVNVYLNASVRVLPPEFLKITVAWGTATNNGLSFYYDFAYPAVYEYIQEGRKTTRTQATSRKPAETLK